MKTLFEIQSRINKIIADQPMRNDKEKKSDRREIKALNECRLYLESNPREEFVKEMLYDSKNRLRNINGAFKKWLPENVPEKEGRKEYDKLMNTKKVKAEIKRLKFLLD